MSAPDPTPALALAAAVREHGGLPESVLDPTGDVEVSDDLALAAIREGHDLHFIGAGAVVVPADPDLALLAGDALYALGLERLAERGDLAAVRVLADTIAGCARAHAEGRPEDAAALWEDAARQLALSRALRR